MPFETYLPFLLTFVIGAVVGAAVFSLLRAGRGQRELLEATGQLSAARAAAHLEETRREDLEGQLEEARSSLAELGSQLAVAEDREVKAEQLITELKTFSERSKKELEDSFKALAAEALAGSSKQFLNLAQERLKTSEERGRAELEERKKAIETLLRPLQETLLKLDDKTLQIEKARVDAYSRIDQQVQLLAQATQSLQNQTTSLTTALSSSQVRGRWGEIALRNVAELAGMTAHQALIERTEEIIELNIMEGDRIYMETLRSKHEILTALGESPDQAEIEAIEAFEKEMQELETEDAIEEAEAAGGLAGGAWSRHRQTNTGCFLGSHVICFV